MVGPWTPAGRGLEQQHQRLSPKAGPEFYFLAHHKSLIESLLQLHCERYLEINLSRRPHSPPSQPQSAIRCPATPARIPTLFLPRQLFQPICAANFTTTTPQRQRPTTLTKWRASFDASMIGSYACSGPLPLPSHLDIPLIFHSPCALCVALSLANLYQEKANIVPTARWN